MRDGRLASLEDMLADALRRLGESGQTIFHRSGRSPERPAARRRGGRFSVICDPERIGDAAEVSST